MPLGRLRFEHQENLKEQAYSLFLNYGIDLDKARRLTRSDISEMLDSKAFKDWHKAQEGKHKVDAAVIQRLDTLIKAIGNLGKTMSRRRTF